MWIISGGAELKKSPNIYIVLSAFNSTETDVNVTARTEQMNIDFGACDVSVIGPDLLSTDWESQPF